MDVKVAFKNYDEKRMWSIRCKFLLQVNLFQTNLFLYQLSWTNPQYDKRLFIELRVQYMKIPSSEHVENMSCTQIVFVLTFRTIYVHNMLSTCSELGNFMYWTCNDGIKFRLHTFYNIFYFNEKVIKLMKLKPAHAKLHLWKNDYEISPRLY